jgi:hypothetical protein
MTIVFSQTDPEPTCKPKVFSQNRDTRRTIRWRRKFTWSWNQIDCHGMDLPNAAFGSRPESCSIASQFIILEVYNLSTFKWLNRKLFSAYPCIDRCFTAEKSSIESHSGKFMSSGDIGYWQSFYIDKGKTSTPWITSNFQKSRHIPELRRRNGRDVEEPCPNLLSDW